MDELSIGVVRGSIPPDGLLRTRWVFKLGGRKPKLARHGRAEVVWLDKETVWYQRHGGVAIVAAGKEANTTRLSELILATPDPAVLLILAGQFTADVWYEMEDVMRAGRSCLVVGPTMDEATVPMVYVRQGVAEVIEAKRDGAVWWLDSRRL